MSTRNKRYLIGGVVLFVLVAVYAVNFFIYPFRADSPNFSDVDKVFSRIEIPNDWELIEESENRGRFGRTCPLESETRCFSKGARYKIPSGLEPAVIEGVYKTSGCTNLSIISNEPLGGNRYVNYRCAVDGLIVDGTLQENDVNWEISIYVSSE